jgi:alpha-tubulin suppressor-like RCC1 family protein
VRQDLYGWGNNSFGQLGVSNITFGQNIPQPKQLPLPENLD